MEIIRIVVMPLCYVDLHIYIRFNSFIYISCEVIFGFIDTKFKNKILSFEDIKPYEVINVFILFSISLL